MQKRKYALLAVGELLADLIGNEFTDNLQSTAQFNRFQGGSPANLAANMARLGNQTAVIASVGNDNLGLFLKNEIAKTGVDVRFVANDSAHPTSIVLVSRTKGTPDFIAYRTADRDLHPHHITDELLAESVFFHTTCFALSQNPAQKTIIEAAKRAAKAGCVLSLDANYAPTIWPNRVEAQKVIESFCQYGGFVKISDDDAERLFGESLHNDDVIARFHAWGASLVCLTLGAKGSIISYQNGQHREFVASLHVEVIDATGAGDAYWAGFLTAHLDGKTPLECAKAGANLAVLKLSTVGPLPQNVSRAVLYES